MISIEGELTLRETVGNSLNPKGTDFHTYTPLIVR
jgi:hypothetical protein